MRISQLDIMLVYRRATISVDMRAASVGALKALTQIITGSPAGKGSLQGSPFCFAHPSRDIPATGVRRSCNIPRFARQRHGTHVLLQGRQIAFERPCRHPRTSRRELSGGVFNCHLKPSNRSSDSLNDLLNSSSESIASSSDFIEDSEFEPPKGALATLV